MRWLLIANGPVNLLGAVSFSPWWPGVRQLFGLPEPAALYLWILSAWVLAFGVAYVVQGWTGRANPAVLALGAWGKCVFAVVLIAQWAAGELPWLAAAAAAPDLAIAGVFAAWLWTRRTTL